MIDDDDVYSGKRGNKVCPEIAEKVMRLAGTKKGEEIIPGEPYMKSHNNLPIFNLLEVLSVSQLKKVKEIKEQREKLAASLRKKLGNTRANIEDEFEELNEDEPDF
jgi:dTDP-4-amino-4,6-dideoxygalactose transaminase